MKILKVRAKYTKAFGFTNRHVSYGKSPSGLYRIEFYFYGYFTLPLYSSKKKPLIKNITAITAVIIPFYPVLFVACILFLSILTYVAGAISFVTDSHNITYTRQFNWANIVIICLLIAYIILA